MQTDVVMAFQIEDGDVISSDEFTYRVKGEPADDGDGLMFDTVDDDGEVTQLWFAPFDAVTIVTSFEDEEVWEPEDIED